MPSTKFTFRVSDPQLKIWISEMHFHPMLSDKNKSTLRLFWHIMICIIKRGAFGLNQMSSWLKKPLSSLRLRQNSVLEFLIRSWNFVPFVSQFLWFYFWKDFNFDLMPDIQHQKWAMSMYLDAGLLVTKSIRRKTNSRGVQLLKYIYFFFS